MTTTKNIIIASLTSIGLFSGAYGQNATKFKGISLQECVAMGIEKNFEVQIAKEEANIAENNYTKGNAGFLPTVDLNASLPGDFTTTSTKSNGTRSSSHEAGIELDGDATVSWTIFEGFKAQATYDRLEKLKQIGEINSRLAIENIIADIALAYYEIVRQEIRLTNLRNAKTLSMERKNIVFERYTLGSASRLDFQQAEVDYNTDHSLFVKQKESLYGYRIALNNLIALEDVAERTIVKDSSITLLPMKSKEEVWKAIEESNSSLLAAEKYNQLKKEDLRIAQARNYPYLNLKGGYDEDSGLYSGTNRRSTITNRLYAGVTLGFTIFDGNNRRREERNAKSNIKIAELESQSLKQSLRADFTRFWSAYQNNKIITELEISNVKTASQYLDIAMERYKLGDLSGIELREAQNSLLDAEDRLSTAQFDTKMCEISIMLLSGEVITLGEF